MANNLLAEIERIPIIDTHEHLRVALRLKQTKKNFGLFDLFATNHYLRADLISAGMKPQEWEEKCEDPREAFQMISPHLAHLQSATYFLSFLDGLKELYDFRERLTSEKEWLKLDRQVKKAHRDSGWEGYVLKKKAKIEKVFYCYGWKYEFGDFFLPVLRMDNFFDLTDKEWPRQWENDHDFTLAELGVKINNFGDFLKAIDKIFRRAKKEKTVAVKMGSAYHRTLAFKPAGLPVARKLFARRKKEVSFEEARTFENATITLLIEKCIQYRLPIQFHTGLPGGNATPLNLTGINPLHLQNLIFAHPQAHFVLFHGGYPYLRESLMLGKKFPNVYLDFCWLPLISYSASRTFLSEALEAVPANKIMWGGDCHNVESTCGAARFLRRLLAEVLEEKVQKKDITRTQAAAIARKILRDNARQLYRV